MTVNHSVVSISDHELFRACMPLQDSPKVEKSCLIKGVWKPGSKKLKWGRVTVKSTISAGYPGGHILLDHIVRAAMPWMDSKLKNYLSNGESLFYENVGMRINEGSDKIVLVSVHSKQTAGIDKGVFLKLIGDLRKDFHKSSKSKGLATDGKHSPKRKHDQHTMGDTKAIERQDPKGKKARGQSPSKDKSLKLTSSCPSRKSPRRQNKGMNQLWEPIVSYQV